MGPNPFIGVVYHWLGGLASGSFYVPYRGVKNGHGKRTGSSAAFFRGSSALGRSRF